MNELPFKHLVFHHDGKSVGPKASGGPIGKAIQEFRSPNSTMPKIINFKPVPAPDIEIDECLLTNHPGCIDFGAAINYSTNTMLNYQACRHS